MFPERIETDRLVLERLCQENVDLRAAYEILAHDDDIEEVTEHMPWTPHETPAETREWIERAEAGWADGTALKYVVRPKTTAEGAGEFAGQAVLWLAWDERAATLGFWLRKRFWGRGYSGERAAAMLELAFDRLDLEVVHVGHTAGNENSRRAIEKYVDRFGGERTATVRNTVPFEDEVRDLCAYAITRNEYLATAADR